MTVSKLGFLFAALGLAACTTTATGDAVHDEADQTETPTDAPSATPPAAPSSSSGSTKPPPATCETDMDCDVGHLGCVDHACRPHSALVTVNGVAATVYDMEVFDVDGSIQANVTFGAPNVNFGISTLFSFSSIGRTGEGCDKIVSDPGLLEQSVVLNADINGKDDVCYPPQSGPSCGLSVTQLRPFNAIFNGAIKDVMSGKTYNVVVSFSAAH